MLRGEFSPAIPAEMTTGNLKPLFSENIRIPP